MGSFKNNVFDDIPDVMPEEILQDLLVTPGVRIERIVSRGQSSPPGFWYDQPEGEWVIVLRGAAILEFEGEAEPHRLLSGDHLNIPPRRRHRVAWTDPDQPTVWIAVFHADRRAD
ncbi:cupin [Skermanella stibiiresistens SB22]|uniref:Cupin n=2 Tax=Skermanella TaxID=204447 RepID=W9H887_9PROT|nr:cupin [Skermanella stibiiresistens SB22]